jgi:hypothetical protein
MTMSVDHYKCGAEGKDFRIDRTIRRSMSLLVPLVFLHDKLMERDIVVFIREIKNLLRKHNIYTLGSLWWQDTNTIASGILSSIFFWFEAPTQ